MKILFAAKIDYKNAFHIVPPCWIATCMEILACEQALSCALGGWREKEGEFGETFRFIASVLNVVNPKFITHSDPEETNVLPRTKRSLPTSLSTPERSLGRRKISARKPLGCHFDSNANESVDALLNIDRIISIEPEQSTRVKVLVL